MSAAFEIPGIVVGHLSANSDLSSSQYLAMTVTSEKADVQTSAGSNSIGVLQNNPKAGQPCAIMVSGVTKMVAGEALSTSGTAVSVDGSGRALAVDSTEIAIGRTLTTASGAGVLVTVNLIPN